MKRLLILPFFVIGAITANAQSLGLRAGANFSNIVKTDDNDFNTEFKTGFHAGITLDIPLVSRLSFAPEIMYSQKGYKSTGTSLLFGENEYSVTTHFVDVPILLKINTGNGFNLHLGPQVSFLTSTTESFKTGSEEFRSTIKEENENLKNNLLGGVIGAGFNVGSRTNIIARYSRDFQKNYDDGSSETPRFKNQVIQVGLGVRF